MENECYCKYEDKRWSWIWMDMDSRLRLIKLAGRNIGLILHVTPANQVTLRHWWQSTTQCAAPPVQHFQCDVLHITIFCRQHWATLRRDYEAVRSVALSARGGIWFGQKLPPSAFVTCPLSSSLLILPCLPRTWYPWLKTWKTRETKTIISYYPADILKKDKDVDCKDNLVQLSAPHWSTLRHTEPHWWTGKIVGFRSRCRKALN